MCDDTAVVAVETDNGLLAAAAAAAIAMAIAVVVEATAATAAAAAAADPPELVAVTVDGAMVVSPTDETQPVPALLPLTTLIVAAAAAAAEAAEHRCGRRL